MKQGDQFKTYFGGPYTVVAVHRQVKIAGLHKKHQRPFERDLVEYRTQSGSTGKILATLAIQI